MRVPPLFRRRMDAMGDASPMTRAEVARRIGVSPDTLRRWAEAGVLNVDGEWTPASLAQARIVARMRARGHSLEEIREATESGRLAFGYVEELLASPSREYTLEEAAAETGLEPALIERMLTT